MKDTLAETVSKVLSDLGVKNPKINFDYPAHLEMGDLSTNVAMAYAKELGSSPVDLANEIKDRIQAHEPKHIKRIDVIKPGFINFFFDEHYFAKNVDEILSKKENYGKGDAWIDAKVMIEYTDPNPFKEFHIGHLMTNVIGESFSRIIEANGAEVKRVNYQGDVGLHVAKAVWAIRKGSSLFEAYAIGNKAYEEDGVKEEIIEINKKIYDKSEPDINSIYEKGRSESLEEFERIYKKLGTKFDMYFFESEVADFGKKTVEENIGSVFEESEGAVVFRGEKVDKKLHTRVFINKEGLPTYEAKELGLAKIKYDKYPYTKSIIVTANEINEYFKVLLAAMSDVFPDLAPKTFHIGHGVMKLPSGKMSSRTGTIVRFEDLLSQVKARVTERIQDDVIAEEIALGAIRYSILHQAIGGDIVFDFDKSISFEGDSGPYLQYSAVRANSILKKADEQLRGSTEASTLGVPENWQTTNIERILERFPEVVNKSATEYAPHHIASYLINLAGEFNSFYSGEKIANSPYRLALTEAFIQVMNSGLYLLGIKVPERM